MEAVKHAPYITNTDSVTTAMREAAMRFGITVDKIDFKVQKVSTTIKDKKTRNSTIVSTISREDLTNPYFMIIQTYEIMLRQIENENEIKKFPQVLFANNGSHTIVYLVIKRNQDLNLNSFSKEDFLNHFEGILLKNKCLIRISTSKILEESIDRIYDNYEAGKLISEDIKIKVLEFPSPTSPIADSLEMLYKKNNEKLDNTGDNKKKLKLASAKKDSILIKYNKVTEGVIGRTYDGKIINVSRIKPHHVPNFAIDSKTIEKEETNECINYIAKETGFVFFEDKLLRIDNQTEMNSANIRNKDKLVTALDDGVSINIKSKDKLSDAVGGNIDIRSDKVNINGNVGPSATVEGNLVKIGGQTHSKSKIKAKQGRIAVHKGEFKGDSVVIDRLEGGTILAQNIHVKTARGGHIEGVNVIIDNLESNVEITASRKIHVENITGESNVFTLKAINYSPDSEEGGEEISLDHFIHEKEILEDAITKQEKLLKEKTFLIEFNEKSLDTQRVDKIDQLRYNIKSSTAMTNKLKAYVKLQEERDKLESDLQKYKKQLEEVDLKIKDIYSDSENAFMEINSEWTGGNSVYVHHDGKIHNFYPTGGTIKSPISFESLQKENLIK